VQRRGTGLLLVMMDVDPDHEEEFNRWYDEEHFPERLQCVGFLSARRYVAEEGSPKYLAIYEMESPEVLQSEAYQRIFAPSEWTQKVTQHVTTMVRNVYRDITPDISEGYQVSAVRPAQAGGSAVEAPVGGAG